MRRYLNKLNEEEPEVSTNDRDFEAKAARPAEKWVVDITCFPTT